MSSKLGQRPQAILEGRLRIAAGFVLLVFAVFGARLFKLQIIDVEILERRSEQNSIRTLRLEAPRGRILDREERVIATTRVAFGLQFVASDLRDRPRTFRALGQLLEQDPAWFEARVAGVGGSQRYRPLRVLDDLTPDRLARVAEHGHVLPGVLTDVQPRRHYPHGELAAHLLGSIGEINAELLGSPAFAGYQPGDVIGRSGLESRFEPHLRGRPGGRNVVVDVAGREVELIEQVSPVQGGAMVLALDLDLQEVAEAAFAEVPEGEPPLAGAAVVLDVRNGDVLVLASRPTYDPNAFAGGIDAQTWQSLSSDPGKPLQNRAVQSSYPPGSTYKPLVASALLEEGVVTPKTRVFCPGYYRFGGRNYRCWKRTGHGSVDLRDALKRSCDVYFYQNGAKLGIDRLARYARAFQLGQPTGIGLPSEVAGLVPSSSWKQQRFKEPWYPGETISASIGQGYNLTTPLQLAVAYAAIANGGEVLEPRLVLRLLTEDGRVAESFPSVTKRRLPTAPEWLAKVREGLTAVVMEPGGTGSRARVEGVSVAGKTGTVQVVRLERTEHLDEDEIPIRYRDHAWFGAFAPAEAPELAVAVFVEHGQHGSSAAAPIAQRILARYFEKRARGNGTPLLAPEAAPPLTAAHTREVGPGLD